MPAPSPAHPHRDQCRARGGTPVAKLIEQSADIYAFTLYEMGYKQLPTIRRDGAPAIHHHRDLWALLLRAR